MSIRTIGIIIKNQDDKILLHDGGYFTKAIVKESDDIRKVITKNLINVVHRDAYRIVKVYKDVTELSAHYSNNINREDITMYVVEVGIFNNEYDFIEKEKVLDKINKTEYIDFYEKYFIRYDKYKFLTYTIYEYFLLIIYILLKFGLFEFIDKDASIAFLSIELGFIIFIYIFTKKYAVPILLNYLINFKINDKTIKGIEVINTIISVLFIIFIIYEYFFT